MFMELFIRQIEAFIFIFAILFIIGCIVHVAKVFIMEEGKLIESKWGPYALGASIAYIVTMLICGFH